MSLTLLRYYLFQDAMKYISASIKSDSNITNQELFKYALFQDSSQFYHLFHPFKKDYYQITNQIFDNKFDTFFLECLNQAYLHSDAKEKIFCYYLIFSYIAESIYRPYIDQIQTKRKTRSYVERMLEGYYFNLNEKKSITKMNLADYFFDSFELSDEDIHLIDKPIKRVFGFFCSKNYFKVCYHNAHFYYNYLSRSKFGFKKLFYRFYDALLNHHKDKMKAKNYPYFRKIDTTILNLNKELYPYTVSELNEQAIKLCKEAADNLNNYFNFSQDTKSIERFISKCRKKV